MLQETRSSSSYTAARRFLTPLSQHSLLICTLDAAPAPKTKQRHSTFHRRLAPFLRLYICECIERFEGLPPSRLTPLALCGGASVFRKPVHHASHLPFNLVNDFMAGDRSTHLDHKVIHAPCPRVHHHIPWCILTQRRGHVGNHRRMTLHMEEIDPAIWQQVTM